jgi:hypothetical protein
MDAVLQEMQTMNLPMTRETYLALAYFGKPVELGAEDEAELPEESQTKEK